MTHELTHLDLFSGIGGFALAAKWNGFRTLAFCDCEPYAQAVLRKHWPDVHVHGDIRQVRGDLYAGVTLLTGGFPCQPFSVAGKQRGKDDNRYLWPEMCRVIREARPAWIIGENVAGIVKLALDTVCADLEAEGYEVEPIIIPACAVDAPHRRDRVWIMANRKREGLERCDRSKNLEMHGDAKQVRSAWPMGFQTQNVSDHDSFLSEHWIKNHGKKNQDERQEPFMHARWLPEPDVGRVAHGIPHRVAKLRGLGNAIVPQVAAEIIRCIREVSQ